MIAHCELAKMLTKGAWYTWSYGLIGNEREDSRIDWTLVNENWVQKWLLMVCNLYMAGSNDHHGLELKLHFLNKPKQPFIYWKSWMRHWGYKGLVQECWGEEISRTTLFRFN